MSDNHMNGEEKLRGDQKSRYFRGKKDNYSNRVQDIPNSQRNGFASNVVLTDPYQANSSAQLEPSGHFNDYPSDYRNNPKHTRGRFGAHQKFSNYNSVPRKNVDQNYSSQTTEASTPVPDSAMDQRGQIVGGRYIRKHKNQSVPHTNNHRTENRTNFEPNVNSNPYKNRTYHTQNVNSFQRPFTNTYQNKNSSSSYNPSLVRNDHTGTSRRSNYRKPERSTNSVSDVYHFPSQPVSYQKGFKTFKEASSSSNSTLGLTYHENEATQRELLIQRLSKGDCECLVCCEQIRVKDDIWHCLSCYHVFHLRCIRKWARSPAAVDAERGWRCPACQNITSKVPYDYLCFCGKTKNPEVNYHLTPHSCGEICSRRRPDCTHPCKDLCHPGPCPPCVIVVQKSCACGKTFKTTTCKQSVEDTCDSVCEKPLNCYFHRCKSKCHSGNCLPCEETVFQECYCEAKNQTVPCTSETAKVKVFSCGGTCSRILECGHHNCESICHPSACSPCSRSTEILKNCACGKHSIENLIATGKAENRTSCLDSIPLCGEVCNKILPCGPKEKPHICQSLCHEGECPKCPLATLLKCRCGAFSKEFSCADITPSFVFLCEKRCNRRKNCGRHKCLNNCCIFIEHKCELMCNKKLSCGTHQCQEPCHMGNCPKCWNVSFDELRCHCGESVLYPPIHCGTRPPECSKLCIRTHPCDHEVKHTCHSDVTCPPCTALTAKWCYGRHKQCGSVMCFMDGVSCGLVCQKNLPCGRHKCKLTCHLGPCLKEAAVCTQPCNIPRTLCGHPCGNACHTDDCPDSPCKAQVTLNCPCGHRSEITTCFDSTKSYRLMSVSVLASKMQEIKDGQSVNLNDVLGRRSKSSKLQCNEECAVIERNKRLAVALQIQNPDLSTSPGQPNYSEFLKTEAKKNLPFVTNVYEKISELVQLAKESKQKCRSFSFPPMNRDQRRVVHELAEFFGCETQSYDEEPKKNVVVTAHKSKCWLPFMTIMAVAQRDMGFRKGPTPIQTQRESKNSSANNTLSTGQKKKIDYFEYNE